MIPVAQIILHLLPNPASNLKQFSVEEGFPPFVADIAVTGFYGFPAHPIEKCVKLGLHAKGLNMKGIPLTKETLEKVKRELIPQEEKKFREFLAKTFPDLSDAKVVGDKICLYCDTFDGHFFIGHDPEREGLMVAAGGSGHGFKFAPVLGEVIADIFEKKENNEFEKRFGWRKSSAEWKPDIARKQSPSTVKSKL